MTADADRHLLFGLIALQVGLIDQEQLVAAFQAWARDKSRPLPEHLQGRGGLDADGRAAVEAMVALHLKKHGGDPERSLVSLPVGRSTLERLAGLGDAALNASLAHAPGPAEPGSESTASVSIGASTSGGRRFRVLRPHARGGLGAVLVALDGELNREVALKQILDHHADDPSSRRRFLIEAEITGGLEHPGIVPVYGLGTYADGRPFYAMRFVQGDSLKSAIAGFHADAALRADRARRSMALRRLLRRFTDVCNTLDYAHARGVLHRDLKPGNIIVGKYGETLVVDWGLAKALGHSDPVSGERTLVPSSASGSAETLPGQALGTPAYMSPEQARGDLDSLDARSDVYSLGATLYCLLTGKPPFKGDDIGAVLRAVQRGDLTPPRQFDPSIDKDLEAVCLKAMATRPEDRYSSCRTLADEIERWLADEPVRARREPLLARAGRWGRRHRPLVAGAAALLITSVVALSVGMVAVSNEQRETERQRVALKKRSGELAETVESQRRKDYISRVNLAYRELLNDDVVLAERLLDGCPADLRGWEWAYVKGLCHGELTTIGRHPSLVRCVAFSPDGRRVVSGSGVGTGYPKEAVGEVVVRDVATGQEMFARRGLKGSVHAVAWSPDGRWIASSNSYQTGDNFLRAEVVIWDAASGEGRRLVSLPNDGAVHTLRFTPNSRRLAGAVSRWDTATDPGSVRVWDVESGAEVLKVTSGNGGRFGLAIHPRGQQMALSRFDAVEIWDLEPLRLVRTLKGHRKQALALAYHPDGRTLASAGWDQTIRLWDIEAGRVVRTLNGHRGQVRSLAFTGDGGRLVSASEDRGLKLWDTASGRELATLHGHAGAVWALDFSSAAGLLASGDRNGIVKLWLPMPMDRLDLRPLPSDLATLYYAVPQLFFSTYGGRQAVYAAFEHDGRVERIACDPLTGQPAKPSLKDWQTEKKRATSQRDRSPDGRWVVKRDGAGRVEIWATEATGRPPIALGALIHRWSFSPDSRRLVTTGTPRRRSPSESDASDPAFHRSEVRVWDLASGRSVLSLDGHTEVVNDVSYSPDGRRIATASYDRTIKLWDSSTGQELFTLRGHGGGVTSLAFSPDGVRIASGGEDGVVKVWNTSPPDPEVLRRRVAVNLLLDVFHREGYNNGDLPRYWQILRAKSDWIARFRSDATLPAPLRDAVVALLRSGQLHGDAYAMNNLIISERTQPAPALDTARKQAENALADRRALASEFPEDHELRSDEALAHLWLWDVHFRARRLDEALHEAHQARAIHERLVGEHPDSDGYRYALAWEEWVIGVTHQNLRHPEEALRYYEVCRDRFGRLFDAADPEEGRGLIAGTLVRLYRHSGPLYIALADLRVASHQPAEALRFLRRARELLESLPDKGGADLYNLACAYSRESDLIGRGRQIPDPEGRLESRRLADRAVDALRLATRAGWRNWKHALRDSDLDPLRPRADFQAVMAEMIDTGFPADPFAR